EMGAESPITYILKVNRKVLVFVQHALRGGIRTDNQTNLKTSTKVLAFIQNGPPYWTRTFFTAFT
ncbi:MAG: hypothetical protein WC231_04340, partial [Dehalococcoidales bacterium]